MAKKSAADYTPLGPIDTSGPKVTQCSQSYAPIGNSLTGGTSGGPTQIKGGSVDKCGKGVI